MAAKALKHESWRFHNKFKKWFQREKQPTDYKDTYEVGDYWFWDPKEWKKKLKKQFTFEYDYLEGIDLENKFNDYYPVDKRMNMNMQGPMGPGGPSRMNSSHSSGMGGPVPNNSNMGGVPNGMSVRSGPAGSYGNNNGYSSMPATGPGGYGMN